MADDDCICGMCVSDRAAKGVTMDGELQARQRQAHLAARERAPLLAYNPERAAIDADPGDVWVRADTPHGHRAYALPCPPWYRRMWQRVVGGRAGR